MILLIFLLMFLFNLNIYEYNKVIALINTLVEVDT